MVPAAVAAPAAEEVHLRLPMKFTTLPAAAVVTVAVEAVDTAQTTIATPRAPAVPVAHTAAAVAVAMAWAVAMEAPVGNTAVPVVNTVNQAPMVRTQPEWILILSAVGKAAALAVEAADTVEMVEMASPAVVVAVADTAEMVETAAETAAAVEAADTVEMVEML